MELLSVHDVAIIMKMSRATIQRWAKMHHMPFVKIGKEYRIRQEDLDSWYNSKIAS